MPPDPPEKREALSVAVHERFVAKEALSGRKATPNHLAITVDLVLEPSPDLETATVSRADLERAAY
jgi:hypothetical protein